MNAKQGNILATHTDREWISLIQKGYLEMKNNILRGKWTRDMNKWYIA
jgi:hypothetical protein